MTRTIHIVHFISCLHYGGTEKVLLALIKGLPQYRHTVLFIHDGALGAQFDALGVARYQVQGLFLAHDPFIFLRLFWRLLRLKPDLVHSTLWVANFVSRIITFLLRIPLVQGYHYDAGYDGRVRNFLDRITGAAFVPAVAASKRTAQSLGAKGIGAQGVRVVVNGIKSFETDLHPIIASHDWDPQVKGCKVYPEPVEGLRSSSSGRTELELFGLRSFGKLRMISYFHGEPVEPSKPQFSNNSPFNLALIARFHPVKNHITFLKALAHLQQKNLPFHAILLGDQLPSDLADFIHQSNLTSHITLITNKPAINYLPFFDCFVLPSHSEGGISLALQEAMAFGLPCIVSHQANTETIIEHNVSGLLFDACDHLQLADAIERVMVSPDLGLRLGENAKVRVQEKCSFQAMVNGYDEVFRDAMRKETTP